MASFLSAGMQDTLLRLGMHSIFQGAAWGPVGTDTVLVIDLVYSSHIREGSSHLDGSGGPVHADTGECDLRTPHSAGAHQEGTFDLE